MDNLWTPLPIIVAAHHDNVLQRGLVHPKLACSPPVVCQTMPCLAASNPRFGAYTPPATPGSFDALISGTDPRSFFLSCSSLFLSFTCAAMVAGPASAAAACDSKGQASSAGSARAKHLECGRPHPRKLQLGQVVGQGCEASTGVKVHTTKIPLGFYIAASSHK